MMPPLKHAKTGHPSHAARPSVSTIIVSKIYCPHSVTSDKIIFQRDAHNKDPRQLKFYAIDRIEQNWRNLNLRREVSRNETYWIFKLNTIRAQGMSVELI